LQYLFDILKTHSRRINLMRDIDLKKIAAKMNGALGVELKVCIGSSDMPTFYFIKHVLELDSAQ
jgi:ATP-dependent 26S proteasome regulatory subunit